MEVGTNRPERQDSFLYLLRREIRKVLNNANSLGILSIPCISSIFLNIFIYFNYSVYYSLYNYIYIYIYLLALKNYIDIYYLLYSSSN